MDEYGCEIWQFTQLPGLDLVFFSVLVGVSSASRADGPAAFSHLFLADEISAFLCAFLICGPENHSVSEIQNEDVGLVLIGVWRKQRLVTLRENNEGDIGFADLAGNGVVAHAAVG